MAGPQDGSSIVSMSRHRILYWMKREVTGRFWWVQADASIFRKGEHWVPCEWTSATFALEMKWKQEGWCRLTTPGHTDARPMHGEAFHFAGANSYLVKAGPKCGRIFPVGVVSTI